MRLIWLSLLFFICSAGYSTFAAAVTCEDLGLTTCTDQGIDICVDTNWDNNHCGGCDRPCDVANNFQCCNGTCADLTSDPHNCGSCGAVCQDFEPCYTIACIDGLCMPDQTDKDSDGDTFFDDACIGGTDCDDSNPDVNPGAKEGPGGDPSCWDGLDNDCDTFVDIQDTSCCLCFTDEDCDDNNFCTNDSCVQCICIRTPLTDGTACDDNNACTHPDTCQSGLCTGPNSVVCTPLDQCHVAGTCNPATGNCSNPQRPDGTPCDDENVCTSNDTCLGGACVGGEPIDADSDGFVSDACGGSDCDDTNASIHPRSPEVCDDGLDQDCNGTDLECGCPDADMDGFYHDACGGSDCDDGNAGNNPDAEEVCDDGVDNDCDGLTDTDEQECPECMSNEECDDGTVCNGVEVCVNTVCHAGTPLNCDDGNICTDDHCDPVDGCEYAYNTIPCETWIYCRPGYCQEGTCVHGEPRDCSHLDDVCYLGRCDDTLDSCIAEQVADEVACDDEDPCTMHEVCVDGVCTSGMPLDEDEDGFVSPDCGGTDCDDQDPGIHPGALDLCDDGIDQDCNGSDLGCDCLDLDDDGYADEACGGRDCDDEDADVNPESEEVCNDEVDNDCDGDTDREDDDCCSEEDCNWVDDDCDGITDNMGTTTCGLGPCQVTVEVCVDGVLQECVPLQPEEFMERSCTDGVDNDCDGNTDYEDLNCLGRTDAGDWWNDRQVTGGGCGCGTAGSQLQWLAIGLVGWILTRRRSRHSGRG